MFILKGTPLEASFYGFYNWAKLGYMGYFASLLHLSESKTIFSLEHVLGL